MRAKLSRDQHGLFHVRGKSEDDAYWGLGYAHATDRPLQMQLMRILGRGEAAKHLDGSDDTVEVDKFFRKMNWANRSQDGLHDRATQLCGAYCDGVNAALKAPWELKLLGYKPDPWSVADIFLMGRVVSYVTLAQSQGEMERLFLEMVQAGVAKDKLQALFPCGDYDEELLKKITLGDRIVPDGVRWLSPVPRAMASNNWVVSGSRTASGMPILANDPHLEINRLPAVWYELVLEYEDRYVMSATMPGLPGLIIGRTPEVAWGVTYSFLDGVDSWIEHETEYTVREETIERKKHDPLKVRFYDNKHGTFDADPTQHDYVLSTQWASSNMGARSINALIDLGSARTTEDALTTLQKMENPFSWVAAGKDGHIGFAMSGLVPVRKDGWNGFTPGLGWDDSYDWKGFVSPEDLPRCIDPEEGYFVTANNDLNKYGKVAPLNLNQGPYRDRRIRQLLSENDKMRPEDQFKIQTDTRSAHAEALMPIVRPLLPDSPQGKLLGDWDLRYDLGSLGAPLFEAFYRELLKDVFSNEGAIDHLLEETGIFADFFVNFDEVLLSETSPWWRDDRETHFKRALQAGLTGNPEPWGTTREIMLTNMLFAGKLPRWLGFDRGPIKLPGGRGSPWQGQIYRAAGRTTSFAPSFRFVTDLSTDEAHTRLAGGVRDRRFSKLYCNEIEPWTRGDYKIVKPGSSRT